MCDERQRRVDHMSFHPTGPELATLATDGALEWATLLAAPDEKPDDPVFRQVVAA